MNYKHYCSICKKLTFWTRRNGVCTQCGFGELKVEA